MNSQLRQVPIEEILELQQEELERKEEEKKQRMKILHDKGIYLNVESIQETDL